MSKAPEPCFECNKRRGVYARDMATGDPWCRECWWTKLAPIISSDVGEESSDEVGDVLDDLWTAE